MRVITQEGVETSLTWWNQMLVEDDSVVLTSEPDDDGGFHKLVIADWPGGQEEIQALFSDLNASIRMGKNIFDLAAWVTDHEVASNE